MSRASQGPANRSRTPRSRPGNRTGTGREADRIKATRAGWASPANAVSTFWRSGPLPAPVAGAAAGIWAALTGLVITVVLTLVVWIFAAGESASDTAMRMGADIWLVAHGTPFVVGAGVWSLLPWAWVVFPALTLWAAGRWVAHRAAIAYPKSAVVAAACLAGPYALIALLAALYGTVTGAAAMPSRALLHAGLLAFVVSFAAIVWRARLAPDLLPRVWRWSRPAVGALAALTAGACVILVAALAVGYPVLSAWLRDLDPGLVGGIALLVAWLGYLPATLMWCLSFVAGTGVTVGGVAVTPVSPVTEQVPLIGLNLLPTTSQPLWLIGILIPVAAGVVLSRLAGRAADWRSWLLPRAAAVGLVLIAVDLWWAISIGRLGAGRLEVLGPPPMAIAVLLAGVVAGTVLEGAAMWAHRRWRSRDVVDITDDVTHADDAEDVPA
ncbi:MAG: hypothetical protein IPG68_08355 [Micrococcales bacterium]|nr:hypothetical protein [Micrococcales bacterium]